MIWVAQRERGSLMLLRLAFWIARGAGWHVGQALLYPITLYFFVSSPSARAVSRDYLARVLPRQPRRADIMRHFFTFACVLLDRIFFLGGRTQAYVLEEHGVDALENVLAQGRGCVLLGAHLGSFDMLRAFGRKSPVPVNPVMYRRQGGVFSRLVEALDPELASRVIDIAAPGAMLKVQECVSRGEIVGFLADRSPGDHGTVDLPFLGGVAAFPIGPLVMASVLRAPVVLFFGARLGPRRYAVCFEPFADSIVLRRSARSEDVRRWMQLYADRVAEMCRIYPFNWFNFYPFWRRPPSVPQTPASAAFVAAALMLLALLAPAHAAGDTPTSLAADIMQRLAALPDRDAAFQEQKTLRSLTAPLTSHGTLIFRHPAYLEKDTAAPDAERLVIDKGNLTIAAAGAVPRRLALDSHPGLRALATTISSTLAGDLDALQALYSIDGVGNLADWRLTLRPHTGQLARFVTMVTLAGAGADLRSLQIDQANGDRDSLTIQPLPSAPH